MKPTAEHSFPDAEPERRLESVLNTQVFGRRRVNLGVMLQSVRGHNRCADKTCSVINFRFQDRWLIKRSLFRQITLPPERLRGCDRLSRCRLFRSAVEASLAIPRIVLRSKRRFVIVRSQAELGNENKALHTKRKIDAA